MKYKNNKHGNIYTVIGEAINCTNAQDGQLMIIYKNETGMVFVREKSEFEVKFTKEVENV